MEQAVRCASFAIAATLVAGASTNLRTTPTEGRRGKNTASLLRFGERQRWDFKSATEEMRTEWGIVLRRYYMVDMEMTDISLKLSELLPEEGQGPMSIDAQDVQMLDRKVTKLATNLENARRDLEVSENTISNMEVDQQLDAQSRDALIKEHEQQQDRAESLSHLGEVALTAAKALLSRVAALGGGPASSPAARAPLATAMPAKVNASQLLTAKAPAAGMRSAGATPSSQGAVSESAPLAPGIESFRAAAKAFQEQRAKLEEGARAASARLLAFRVHLKLARK